MDQRAEKRYGQEGNRWVNQTPSGSEIAEWFKANVPIDDALDHDDYIGGVTLIPNKEKSKVVTGWEGTAPVLGEVEDLVLTPYMRVETRVKYFHDLCAAKGWVGFIDPQPPEKADARLPHGLFSTAVATADKKEVRFVGCSMRVSAYEKEGFEERAILLDKRTGEEGLRRFGKLVLHGAPASKVVPTLGRYGADVNALMKAETGAVGRALGMAGMLVIPGAGIATAEDLQEEGTSAGAQEPQGDPDVPGFQPASELDGDDVLRAQITEWLTVMESSYPKAAAEFKAWAKERNFGLLSEITSPALRGMHRKAKGTLDQAVEAEEKAASSEPTVKPPAEEPAKQ